MGHDCADEIAPWDLLMCCLKLSASVRRQSTACLLILEIISFLANSGNQHLTQVRLMDNNNNNILLIKISYFFIMNIFYKTL